MLAASSPAPPGYPCLVERLARIGSELRLDLRVVRDDLLPFLGGGNKVRKGSRIIEAAAAAGATAIVTTGGLQSNHARVMAIMAARRGWPCALVLHGQAGAMERPAGNLLMMVLAGARILTCEPDEIADFLGREVDRLTGEGERPFLVPGGGHSTEGALAYVDAVDALAEAAGSWVPDFIVLASGTGGTQAGIMVGCARRGWNCRVVGISVARPRSRGADIIADSCRDLTARLGLASAVQPVDFRDAWVGAGYGKAGPEVLSVLRRLARSEGLLLDPTYTAKAFHAFLDLAAAGEFPELSKVLFWHTGGLPNLLASDAIGDGMTS